MNVKEIKDIAGRFDISDTEADRIADAVESEAEFIAVWENHNWWTDENNDQPSGGYSLHHTGERQMAFNRKMADSAANNLSRVSEELEEAGLTTLATAARDIMDRLEAVLEGDSPFPSDDE